MQLRYVFTELGQGLRRNISMHIAVVLTLLVALTLVGLGALLKQQADRAADYWGSQLEITVFLCRDRDANPACTGEVTDAQRTAVLDTVEDNPEVEGYSLKSKEEAFQEVKELFGEERFDGPNAIMSAEAMPESVRIQLEDPERYKGITSAVVGLDGVSEVQDMRDELEPIYGFIGTLQWTSLGTAAFLVLAALLLVGNTIRLAAFARRREIGIMRLVGASTSYIALPFLLEALVTALIGVALATGALGAFMWFGIAERASDQFQFIPWIGLGEFGYAVALIAVLGPLLTLLPTLALTRKYLKV